MGTGWNTPTEDFLIQVARGKIKDHSLVYLNGRNDNVDTAIVDINMRNDLFVFIESAAAFELVSDDANDSSTGIGARLVKVQGLASDFSLQEEDVVTDGTTPVSLVNNYIRINELVVKKVGTYSNTSTGSGPKCGCVIVFREYPRSGNSIRRL